MVYTVTSSCDGLKIVDDNKYVESKITKLPGELDFILL